MSQVYVGNQSGGASSLLTLTGNTGGPQSPTAGNIDIVTSNTSLVFAGSDSALVLDFSDSNILLGSTATPSGVNNISLGVGALAQIDTGSGNTMIGVNSGTLITSADG